MISGPAMDMMVRFRKLFTLKATRNATMHARTRGAEN
jgi:hypothetical protein